MKEKYNVILDTDIGNSWDDQFALVYLLKNDEMFNIEAITIAPFRHNEKESIIDNQELSYNEIIKISNLVNKDVNDKIYKFGENEATKKIIEVAKKNEKTYILAIGALTNIYSAIEKDISIIDKIEVIWLGGNSIEYGNNEEFNFMQDTNATLKLINSNVKMTIIPARNVAIDLMININELKNRMNMNSKISDYLCNKFVNDNFYGIKTQRVIWDISVIAYLINKDWFKTKNLKGLSLSDDLKYYIDSNRPTKTIIEKIDSKKIYDNLFEVLKRW